MNKLSIIPRCMPRFHQAVFFLLLLIVVLTPCVAAQTDGTEDRVVTASDGTDLDIQVYPAEGNHLALWLVSGQGARERSSEIATQLAGKGVEVWQVDLAESLFLTRSAEQLRSIDATYVAELLSQAHQKTRKKILGIAGSYHAIPLLRGIRIWQQQAAKPYLLGAVLLTPSLYATVPSLGMDPEYVPVVKSTNIPIAIFQDGKRGNRWYVDQLIQHLRSGGSQVTLTVFEGVAGLLYEGDNSAQTLQTVTELPDRIIASIAMLSTSPVPSIPAPAARGYEPKGSGIDDRLKPFKANLQPPAIDLPNILGGNYRRANYQGQITVVNFWATWCPPCVQEIPSLNRLKSAMQDVPFELISINYAEEVNAVNEFLRRVDVKFPVLLDIDGKFAASWNVVAFPSTFVIGPNGKIRYGVNAGIHWDNPEVMKKLRALVNDGS